MFKLGHRFYDERNGRYFIIDAVCRNIKCYWCATLELDENGEFNITDTVLITHCELSKMMEV